MLPLTRKIPKPLIEIEDGRTILDTQLDAVATCGGISEILIVVGYRAEQIERHCQPYNAVPVRFIYNPFFDQTNNLVSLWFATTHVDDDFVVINGDDVFDFGCMDDCRRAGSATQRPGPSRRWNRSATTSERAATRPRRFEN